MSFVICSEIVHKNVQSLRDLRSRREVGEISGLLGY